MTFDQIILLAAWGESSVIAALACVCLLLWWDRKRLEGMLKKGKSDER